MSNFHLHFIFHVVVRILLILLPQLFLAFPFRDLLLLSPFLPSLALSFHLWTAAVLLSASACAFLHSVTSFLCQPSVNTSYIISSLEKSRNLIRISYFLSSYSLNFYMTFIFYLFFQSTLHLFTSGISITLPNNMSQEVTYNLISDYVG